MKYLGVWILIALLTAIGATLRFSNSHEKMPVGCDEFGYLNQAKAIDEGITFTNHSSRPWLSGLLDTLRKAGITEQEISWMVTPHAYHVIPGSDKIINQYPAGTAFILSSVPLPIRKIIFPFLTLLLLVIPVVIARGFRTNFTWFEPAFAAFILLMIYSPPFITELTRVNSLAFTWGLLIAAGMLLNRQPLWSCLLIALSVNFRSANMLMVLPVFLFIIPKGKLIPNIKTTLIFLAATLIAVAPALWYNHQLVGSAFSSTYSSIDTALAGWQEISNRADFYFDWNQHWFRVNLLAFVTCLLILIFNRATLNKWLGIILVPVINYSFFLIHEVKMDYYPYASAMILIGFIFDQLCDLSVTKKLERLVAITMSGIVLFILIAGISRYMKKEHLSFDQARAEYSALCNFEIVWADLYSGTSEYVCNNNGFRYGTTTPRARKTAMQYLSRNNYRQAILLDDNTVTAENIVKEISETELRYSILTDSKLKRILIIE